MLRLVIAGISLSCARPQQQAFYPDIPPLAVDPDKVPFEGKPSEYYTSQVSDGIDKTLLRPWARLFAFNSEREATNVNTLDELPDSSWFQNRMGHIAMSLAALTNGPCEDPPPQPPWSVIGAKASGASPGFLIKSSAGNRYLIKFDNPGQGPRASAADVIVSRLYHAAGYFVPCNRVVTFDRAVLSVAPGATRKDSLGNKHPLSVSDVDKLLDAIPPRVGGKYRALASQWLPGSSLGPWRFEQRRDDDPNDIVEHEDRRELRGLKVLAAWVGHKDQRSENTLASWIETSPGVGWIRHAFLDFGDSFGHFTQPAMLARRLAGHAHGFDLPQAATDLVTFGFIQRHFESERFGPSGPVFGYFNVERFRPGSWKSVFPNPAFLKMTERDAAWMARIIASFEKKHLRALTAMGLQGYPELEDELLRILLGRQQAILRRYLTRLSPLHRPSVSRDERGAFTLCFEDLSERIQPKLTTRFRGRLAMNTAPPRRVPVGVVEGRVCVGLPTPQRSAKSALPVVVELESVGGNSTDGALLRVFLYEQVTSSDELGYRIVALERPDSRVR